MSLKILVESGGRAKEEGRREKGEGGEADEFVHVCAQKDRLSESENENESESAINLCVALPELSVFSTASVGCVLARAPPCAQVDGAWSRKRNVFRSPQRLLTQPPPLPGTRAPLLLLSLSDSIFYPSCFVAVVLPGEHHLLFSNGKNGCRGQAEEQEPH